MYQLGFQDPATSTMEGIFLFNLDLFFVIISIVFLVAWLIFILLKNFIDSNNSIVQTSSHSNMLNIIWTSIPALILLSLVSPLFSLPHNFDEILPNPELTLTLWDLIFFVISPRELILITFNLFLIYAVLDLAGLWIWLEDQSQDTFDWLEDKLQELVDWIENGLSELWDWLVGS